MKSLLLELFWGQITVHPLLLKDNENPLQHWSGRMAEFLSLSPSQPGTSGWGHEPSVCKSWASGAGVFVPRNRNEGENLLHIFSVFWSVSQLENEITHLVQQQPLKYVLADSEEIKWSRKETENCWHHTSKERLPNGKNALKMGLNLTNSKILESDESTGWWGIGLNEHINHCSSMSVTLCSVLCTSFLYLEMQGCYRTIDEMPPEGEKKAELLIPTYFTLQRKLALGFSGGLCFLFMVQYIPTDRSKKSGDRAAYAQEAIVAASRI